MVPKLLSAPKWFKSGESLQVNDIVFFQKEENVLSSKWTIGKIIEVEKGRDGLVRRAWIQYQNASEEAPRETDRAARSIVKLMNIDDTNWLDEMAEIEKLVDLLEKDSLSTNDVVDENLSTNKNIVNAGGEFSRSRLNATSGNFGLTRETGVQRSKEAKSKRSLFMKPCRRCCCVSHCLFFKHSEKDEMVNVADTKCPQVNYENMLDKSWVEVNYLDDTNFAAKNEDPLMSLLCATNLDLKEVYSPLKPAL